MLQWGMEEQKNYKYKAETLEHLGLVAAMYDELKIGEIVDSLVPQDKKQRKITLGQILKAMVLNGLGFANSRLYLLSQFFENKPLDRLIGPDIKATSLNDDLLGRGLEKFYQFGVTELYRQIAVEAAKNLGIKPKIGHMDTTSMYVHGEYNSGEESKNTDSKVIAIKKGYSRDHREDLNQVMLNLIIEHQAKIPVLMQPLSGNSSDKVVFEQAIKNHVRQLKMDHGLEVIVADSASYTEQCLKAYAEQDIIWITRVPANIKQAKDTLQEIKVEAMKPLTKGYFYKPVSMEYAGVKQRWLVIYSEKAVKRSNKRVERYFSKHSLQEKQAWKELCRESYSCKKDAQKALEKFQSGLKATEVVDSKLIRQKYYAKSGRPAKGIKPARTEYQISGNLIVSKLKSSKLKELGACFILASNELSEERLSDTEMLISYKDQKYAERGFRFLKDPMFCASTIYLKKVSRIMALLMVMTVCLLVYSALEYRIRNTLQENKTNLPDQKGKPTQTPTTRWVFNLFMDVQLLTICGSVVKKVVLNLKPQLYKFLELLGPNYAANYTNEDG